MDALRNRKVLVSGGTGFLGSHLIVNLLEQGAIVSVLVRETSSLRRLEKYKSQIQLIEIKGSYKKHLKEIVYDYFFHIATCYGRQGESVETIYQANLKWPLELLDVIDHNDLILVNFGTSLPEDLNDYTRSKYQFMKMVKESSQGKIINLVLEQFFGPDDGTFLSFVIKQFAAEVDELKLTEGIQKRDFIYYKDVLTAITTILTYSKKGKFKKYDEFSIGTGKVLSIREAVEMIKIRMRNERTKLLWGALAYRPNEVMISSATPERLVELGWKVQYDFSDAVSEILKK